MHQVAESVEELLPSRQAMSLKHDAALTRDTSQGLDGNHPDPSDSPELQFALTHQPVDGIPRHPAEHGSRVMDRDKERYVLRAGHSASPPVLLCPVGNRFQRMIRIIEGPGDCL
jgi:hypothetical protein